MTLKQFLGPFSPNILKIYFKNIKSWFSQFLRINFSDFKTCLKFIKAENRLIFHFNFISKNIINVELQFPPGFPFAGQQSQGNRNYPPFPPICNSCSSSISVNWIWGPDFDSELCPNPIFTKNYWNFVIIMIYLKKYLLRHFKY
jgi:hypothetical protein